MLSRPVPGASPDTRPENRFGVRHWLRRCLGSRVRRHERRAATAIEYAFCASFILCVAIVGVQALGGMLKKSATSTSEKIEQITPDK